MVKIERSDQEMSPKTFLRLKDCLKNLTLKEINKEKVSLNRLKLFPIDDKLLRQGLESTESAGHSGYFAENSDMMMQLVEDGVISRDDYEKFKKV